jgi:hypothetical protein
MPVAGGGASPLTNANPADSNAFRILSANTVSAPVTRNPTTRFPNALNVIRRSSNGTFLERKARINCSPKIAPSVSRAYEWIIIFSPGWLWEISANLFARSTVTMRGWICCSNAKFSAFKSAASFSSFAARSRVDADCSFIKAIICSLTLLASICIHSSAESAAIRNNVDTLPPWAFHQGNLLNQDVKSWRYSPNTPTVTAAIDTYPAIS